jgi:hypothetical protein
MIVEIVPRRADSDARSGMRMLRRLGAWGGAAVLALAAAALASQTGTGRQRLAMVLAPAALPVHAVATVKIKPPAEDAETKRLAAQVRDLTADRDRLSARVANLEQQLDGLTGSIKRLAALDTPPATTAPPPAPSVPATSAATVALPAAPAATPTVTTQEAAVPDKPQAQQAVTVVSAKAETPPAMEPAPPALQNVPLPPVRLAAIDPAKLAFGVALAGSSSVVLTHMQWAAVKANFGPLLQGLQPHVLTEHRGTSTHYRLLVGPLTSYTDAAKLCARILAEHGNCHPVKFGGEPL